MASTSTAAATSTAHANYMAGAPNLQEGARATLITLVEDHVTSLIRQAACVTAHCKRARTHHVSSIETGGGGGGGGGGGSGAEDGGSPPVETTTVRIVKRRLHAEDLNLALQWRGSEKLYATGLTTSSAAAAAAGDSAINTSAAAAATEQHHYNKVVDLKEYLRSEMEFQAPHEVGLTVHWLAVDGQQPRIPKNPTEKTRRGRAVAGLVHRVEQSSYGGDDDDDDVLLVGASAADGMSTDNTNSIGGGGSASNNPSANNNNSAAAAAMAAKKHKGAVQVSQLRAQLLSEELQLYFCRVTSTLERGGATPTARQQQDTALASVGRDTGLQELVPFLVDYILHSHEAHVGNPEQSHVLVRLVQALLANPHLHLELHLQRLLPMLLTYVVAKKLSSRPWENHWSLRTAAARTLVSVCRRFGDKYANLEPRVLHELCLATEAQRPLATRYGGFVALSLFGPRAIASFLLPLATDNWNTWQQTLDQTTNLEQRLELQMFQQAILNALGEFLGQGTQAASQALDLEWEDLEETFGDRLVLLSNDETDYALCAI